MIDRAMVDITQINRLKITALNFDGVRRLPCPAQSDFPQRVTCGTETNIRVSAGQGTRLNLDSTSDNPDEAQAREGDRDDRESPGLTV